MGTRPITFLSDYGTTDEFAGVCRAVIASIAPDAAVIDLSHGIRRHDVRRGATVLAEAVAFAPAGVHLAVVDPGVGGERRAVAVASNEGERLFVGPDNGLLASAIERFGGAAEAVDVSESPVRLEPVSATFHGRDIFAPVAAHLARGAVPESLGQPIDPETLEVLPAARPEIEAGLRLTAEGEPLLYVDSSGSLALAVNRGDAARRLDIEPGERIALTRG